MLITRTSLFSGIKREKELDIDEDCYNAWKAGLMLIQDAAPRLSADDREFIITGATPEEWDGAFEEKDEPSTPSES